MDQKSDFWIVAELDNGMIVELFDPECFARNFEINKIIDCLILAFYVQDINAVNFEYGHDKEHPILTGRYIGEYTLPNNWVERIKKLKPKTYSEVQVSTSDGQILANYDKHKKVKEELHTYPAVQTVNGILLLSFDSIPKELNIGDIITFSVGRLDLLAWRPID